MKKKRLDPQTQAIVDHIAAVAPGALMVDGHDNAIVGTLESFDSNGKDILVYDRWIVLDNLKKQGMSREEAEEFFYHNILGAFVGENTPVYVDPLWRYIRATPPVTKVRK